MFVRRRCDDARIATRFATHLTRFEQLVLPRLRSYAASDPLEIWLEREAAFFWVAVMPSLPAYGFGNNPGAALEHLRCEAIVEARRIVRTDGPSSDHPAWQVLRADAACTLAEMIEQSARLNESVRAAN